MEIIEAYNSANNSSLTLANDLRVHHESASDFRQAVIWKTFKGWETPDVLRSRLVMPLLPYRVPELRIMVRKLLELTPSDAPNLNDIEQCFRVQNARNIAEYVWQKSECFGYLSWGASV